MSAETLAAKAVRLAPSVVWGVVPGRRDLLRCVSPVSGNTYVLTLCADGNVRCSCPAGCSGRECFHVLSFAVDYDNYTEAFADLTRSALLPVSPVRAPRPGDKTFIADWAV